MQEPIATSDLKLGIHRGSPRLWIEGVKLQNAGFNWGDRYQIEQTSNGLIIRLSADGPNEVAGRNRGGRELPIIDRHDPSWSQLFLSGRVNVRFFANRILVTDSLQGSRIVDTNRASTWIFQSNPDRYDVVGAVKANRRDVWATNQHRNLVGIGDKIYFYQSGNHAGIYAIGRVVSLPFDRGESFEFGQWAVNIEYEKILQPYVRRQELLSDDILRNEKRGKVKVFERYQGTNWPLSDTASERLESLVGSRNSLLVVDPAIPAKDSIDDDNSSDSEPDRVTRSILERRGQKRFREKLLAAYENLCAITADGPIDVLEAAHVEPYAISGSDHPSNGLLLRADIHTLFDLDLIKINPDSLQVEITATLVGSSYEFLDGRKIKDRVDGEVLSNARLRKRYESLEK
jgi:putative restriction endonuclease